MTAGVRAELLELTADAVVVIHLLWILFLIGGVLLGRRWAWARRLHVGGLTFAVGLTAGGWVCPLTHLELWLRRRAGGRGYAGSFIGHHAEQLVYLDVPGWGLWAALLLIIATSLAAYRGAGTRRERGREGRT